MMVESFNIHLASSPPMRTKREHIPKSSSAASVPNVESRFKRGNSFVVGQKLRESKWFRHEELAIFCAVVETGFIIEVKDEAGTIDYGIASWTPGKDKSKDPNYLTIHTLDKGNNKKIIDKPLLEFWFNESTVRINNKKDKDTNPLAETDVRNQIEFAKEIKRKWHNSEHLTYFCRYGPVENFSRTRKITDHLKWNAGAFFTKIKGFTTK